jgi:Fe-S cluster assembly protein SufD
VTAPYAQDFAVLASNGGSKAPWLSQLRRSAMDRFTERGFPSAREEDWRFTNITPITSAGFPLTGANRVAVEATDPGPFLFQLPGVSTLVFVNGRYVPGLSHVEKQPDGVVVSSLAIALATQGELLAEHVGRYAQYGNNGFTALNTAFVHDGLFVRVPAGVELPGPVHALFISDGSEGGASYPRNLLLVEAKSRGAVLESYVSLAETRHFTNTVTEAVVGDGARLEHTKIQRESERAYHVGTTHVHQGRDSRVESFSVSLGAALCRNNLDVTLNGSGIESHLFGLYMARGRQEVDNHTSILHAHPNCSTREIYKGILDDAAHAVFNGKVYVTREAQKTDAKQTNRNLLLSDRAKVDTKPQLEIFADDVKCTHGATVGNLDPLAAFYLKSRGIPPLLARKVLTYAFAAEVLEALPYEPVRSALEALVMARLEQREAV